MEKIKIGLFGIGLEKYWSQFDGLLERLIGYQSQLNKKIAQDDEIEVIDAGMIDNIDKARTAADKFKQEDVSLIFLYVSTYALSATVLPVVQKNNVPVIILNLQPTRAIDYNWFNNLKDRGIMTGEWLANCQACSVPEISNVFSRANIDFHQITGTLNDEESWNEITGWIEAAKVAAIMRTNKLGLLGHYYNGMLDMYSDLTAHSVVFGNYFQHIEMDELQEIGNAVTELEIESKLKQIYEEFTVLDECPEDAIQKAARTSVALDKLVVKHQLGSLAYYYEGAAGNEFEEISSSVITGNSILTAHHVPVAGEYEIKNVQAMKIMDAFGAGGSFSEFYALDFNDDIILLGHDGPGHLAIAEGKPLLKPLGVYHGKPGKGLSVEMKVKYGPVTLLSVAENKDGGLKLIVAEGMSVPGPILEIGNTNSRYKFSLNVKDFINQWCAEGPAHHCAIGVGHISSKIEKLGKILKMEVVIIGT
jgi:L-arabinose isomerase